MASRVKIKVSAKCCNGGGALVVAGRCCSPACGANEQVKVSTPPSTMRKEISANNTSGGGVVTMNRPSRRPLKHVGGDTHLARDSNSSFQCYRSSNLGLISMLPLVLLVLVSSLLTSPVNGESCLSPV